MPWFHSSGRLARFENSGRARLVEAAFAVRGGGSTRPHDGRGRADACGRLKPDPPVLEWSRAVLLSVTSFQHIFRFTIWLVTGCLLVPTARTEGAREFLIQSWTGENGLPGNTVTSVAQTPDGYLWVGTLSGLARFDGVRFVNVDLAKVMKAHDTMVTCLYTDRRGDLWIGTEEGSLLRYRLGTFRRFQPPSHQTADRYVQRIAEDDTGTLWTLNYEGGVCQFRQGDFHLETDNRDNLGLAIASVGGMWVASRHELWQHVGDRLDSVWNDAREPGFVLAAITPAREGGCWLAGGGRIRRFDAGEMREERARYDRMGSAMSGFLEDRLGNLWLANYGGGIVVCDADGMTRRLTRAQGLPGDLVRCLFEDREGNIWAGVEARGLVRIRRALFASYGKREGLTDETVLAICEGAPGEVWVGSNGDGVYCIQDGHVRHFGAEAGLSNEFVWSLCRDRAGRLWAGTWGGGLFRLEGDRFVSVDDGFGAASAVLALHEARDGTLWLGQRTGPDRVMETIKQGRRHVVPVPGTLPRLDVRNLAETPDGSLWFGTVEEGLLRWQDGRFSRCEGDQGLSTQTISALQVDTAGDLWAAAPGSGLALWKQDGFLTIHGTGPLFEETLFQILDDGLGYLWCGVQSGVVRVRKSALRQLARGESVAWEWQRFTKADGLPGSVSSRGACRTQDGRLWFGTLSGLAVVDPRRVPDPPAPPPVLIESVHLGGRLIYDHASARVRPAKTKATEATPTATSASGEFLEISPGHWPLDISYTALHFTAPERVRFRYQLVGLEEPPVEAATARTIRYSYLPPGRYELRVAASHEGGARNGTDTRLAFVVLPRYWETTWFRALALAAFALSVGGLVSLVARARHRGRILRLEKLHAVERERARIARDIHDELGGSLTEISFLGALAARESTSLTETRDQVKRIIVRANELTRTLDEIVWVVNPKNDSVDKLVPYLCQFTREFLEPTPLACRFEVSPQLPAAPLSAELRHNLFLILKEALNNCVRHAGATKVQLSLSAADGMFVMELADDGSGFPAVAGGLAGNGLRNMRQRAETIKAGLDIRSSGNIGTTVRLCLPLAVGGDGKPG